MFQYFLKKRLKFILKIYLKNHIQNEKICINFTIFKNKIRKFFDVFNEKQTIKKIIQYLIQYISTTNYVIQFRKKKKFYRLKRHNINDNI